MANFTVTPNMSLVLPIPGQDPGPDYGTNQYSSGLILDGHNHSSGSGVQINPSGLNINSDLPMNGNNLTLVNTVRFNNLVSSLSGTAPNLGAVYVAANELWFNDPSGNVVQMTLSGAVNATSSGISSGTASAAFSGGVLVVNSNTNTPANIQAGSILIGNNIAASNFATLQAPTSLAASYSLTLPPSNTLGTTGFLTMDTSNNMSASVSVSGGIITSNIANGAITLPLMSAPNMVASTSSGAFQSSSASFVQVTNQLVSITTTGKPVSISFQADVSATSYIGINPFVNTATPGSFNIYKDGVSILDIQLYGSVLNGFVTYAPASLNYIDQAPTAATHTYALYVAGSAATTCFVNNIIMVVREL